jgi:pimeloyl-ACP methyl ester carboxylesterase
MSPPFVRVIVFVIALHALLAGRALAQDADLEPARQLLQQQEWASAVEMLERIVEAEPEHANAWFMLGYAHHNRRALDEAYAAYRHAVASRAVAATAYYNMACIHAVRSEPDEAFARLDDAFRAGFSDAETMRTDPDLDSIRSDARFVLPPEPTFETFTASNGVRIEFGLVLPPDLDDGRPRRVLVGFPPGNQSRSAAETAMAYWWGGHAARRGWISITVIVPDGGWFGPRGEQAMGELLDAVQTRFTVAGDEFHVAGCSGGGASSFHIALVHADRVASYTGLPAYPRRDDMGELARLRTAPVYLWVGADDTGWLRSVTSADAALRKAGVPSRLVVFPDEGHVIQQLLGGGFMERLEESLAAEVR